MPIEELSQTQISEQLNLLFSKLTGQQMTIVSGAADMRLFKFGPYFPSVSITGKEGIDTHYSLHVQSPWSLSQNAKLLTGYSDRSYAPDGTYPEEMPSLFDSLQQKIFQDLLLDQDSSEKRIFNRTDHFKVISISLLDALRLEIKLSPDYVLHIFPDRSKDEHWRFLTKERHYVAEETTIYIISDDD